MPMLRIVLCLPDHEEQMCRPITKALFRCDPDLAVKTFLDAEAFYHPIARNQLRKVRKTSYVATHRLIYWLRTGPQAASGVCVETEFSKQPK